MAPFLLGNVLLQTIWFLTTDTINTGNRLEVRGPQSLHTRPGTNEEIEEDPQTFSSSKPTQCLGVKTTPQILAYCVHLKPAQIFYITYNQEGTQQCERAYLWSSHGQGLCVGQRHSRWPLLWPSHILGESVDR